MKKENNNRSKIVHLYIIILVVFIICAIAAIIMLKYQVEGEKNPPFSLTDFMLVSSAEGKEVSLEGEEKWKFSLNQTNDIYMVIKKNENYNKSEIIKKISIENIQITKNPQIGNLKIYRPAEEGLYKQEDVYVVEDSLEYKGAKESNIKNMEIANQGGVILFRIENEEIANYASNDEEIIHDGTLLGRANITMEQIEAEMSFDIIVETGKGIKYKTTMTQKIPAPNLIEEGKGTLEEDLSNLVFKRI